MTTKTEAPWMKNCPACLSAYEPGRCDCCGEPLPDYEAQAERIRRLETTLRACKDTFARLGFDPESIAIESIDAALKEAEDEKA